MPSRCAIRELKFVLPHFGAGYLREALMLADLCPNVYLDTSSSNSWMRYEGLDLKTVFRRALDVVGPQRLLFGTDSSFFPRGWNYAIFEAQTRAMLDLGISADGRAPDHRRESAPTVRRVRGISSTEWIGTWHSYATPHVSRFRLGPARPARSAPLSNSTSPPSSGHACSSAANKYLTEAPVTVTAARSPRSAGGQARFLQRRRLLVARPGEPEGPYIQRDGMTNPDNFVEHRRAMIRLSPGSARTGRGVQAHQRSQVRRPCGRPPARLVCGRSDAA